MPVASGLFAGAGIVPESAPTVGELEGVTCAGAVPDDVGDELGVPEGVLVGDGLPGDEEGELVGDGLPVGDVLGEPDAVGEQLGVVDQADPLLPWPDGVVPPALVPG